MSIARTGRTTNGVKKATSASTTPWMLFMIWIGPSSAPVPLASAVLTRPTGPKSVPKASGIRKDGKLTTVSIRRVTSPAPGNGTSARITAMKDPRTMHPRVAMMATRSVVHNALSTSGSDRANPQASPVCAPSAFSREVMTIWLSG